MPSPAPCPTPEGCPTPQPCSEVFDAQCVVYTGENIICNDRDVLVTTNDTVSQALVNIINYFCEAQTQKIKKFIRTVNSVFDGATVTISKADLEDCGLFAEQGCSTTAETTRPCDLNINLYFREASGNIWYKMAIADTTSPTGVKVEINNTTGNITIIFDIAPISPAAEVRIVIIG